PNNCSFRRWAPGPQWRSRGDYRPDSCLLRSSAPWADPEAGCPALALSANPPQMLAPALPTRWTHRIQSNRVDSLGRERSMILETAPGRHSARIPAADRTRRNWWPQPTKPGSVAPSNLQSLEEGFSLDRSS